MTFSSKPAPQSSSPRHPQPGDAELSRFPSEVVRAEPRNMAAMAINAIVLRTGWIFKTESVIIPAFLDSIAGAGWMRGLLPVLNRLGQSLAPFLLARQLTLLPRKKYALLVTTLGMAVPFLAIGGGLFVFGSQPRGWYPLAFLVLYTLFFCATGLNMISAATLQGKLIRADRRGRFLALATMGGTVPACICAWFLLPGWLAESGGYAKIFTFTGVLFAASAIAVFGVTEPADRYEQERVGFGQQFRGAWQILRADRNYRLLIAVGALFTTSLILLPHYQALARDRLGLAEGNLMLWVVWQNVAVGVASLVVGPLADRFGNRLILRIVIFASALVPPLALLIAQLPEETGRALFTWVFVGIGLTPIAFRLSANYILEIAPDEEHPRYLSIAQICNAAVILSSPIFGQMVDVAGFEGVFLSVAALIAIGGLLTFALDDPRSRR